MIRCEICLCACPSWLPVCSHCLPRLPWNTSACPTCALPLPTPGEVCSCASAPGFTTRSAFIYRFPVQGWVHRLKYQQQPGMARWLGALMASALVSSPTAFDLVTSVPAHSSALRRRGYNQSDLLAAAAARRLKRPFRQCAFKQRDTHHQRGLDRSARQRNLQDAFCVSSDAMPHVTDRNIVIIDDVVTTGATGQALGSVLLEAGARSVTLWSLARAPTALVDNQAIVLKPQRAGLSPSPT